ncbi:cytochrome c maturation protein CcmE [Candidatus Pelagibacter sp.]|jgi:cytochrome c-type biogenesis protein CcmE|nr:cytochrome c maturation protein CcmE [Candidatus Pelagibacter sp.]OCW75643.1 cytochrome C biogenesis protein CcmE [Pelagibacteraceae bacterium GOM-A2]OCW82118.1 cytochrome C biogenesis protein CcmE [Pelagibacteraceae bacterium GOM-A5]MDC2973599.1 cytochrome c maturation protein CcmE [Candidatus Pelagibacter sp.]MDC3020090.1 cytochrome c maturation protein CcmE [Candidatus Pelagibacter sp.]|tara:strand:- start:245 stop:667 length:423 start_codon:yes stop_codon:yes gene_type:complete
MYGKKVKFRALFIFLILISLVLTIFLVVKSLEENVVYFKSPTDIKNLNEIKNAQKIRVGGMVKKNSIKINDKEIFFVITDFKNELLVNFNGSVPNLFEEGKGVVAEGFLKDKSFLNADKILAKHDENYMPPEVSEAMKNN